MQQSYTPTGTPILPSTPGGSGPSQNVGGASPIFPTLPVPGAQMFVNIISQDAAESAGELGGQTIISEVPGDLGTNYSNLNRYLLTSDANRDNGTFNGMVQFNHRYMGHRESTKYNLAIQQLLTICCSLYLTLYPANAALTSSETVAMYPTDTEISCVYHVREQMEFKEWLISKDADVQWFNN